mmetsp:Transcript_24788/g.69043  ORF Transcript_24788/g.69043 Transcript_24788/m.69043 type:complete len:303 (-) Transcript_24788:3049-3957(-)
MLLCLPCDVAVALLGGPCLAGTGGDPRPCGRQVGWRHPSPGRDVRPTCLWQLVLVDEDVHDDLFLILQALDPSGGVLLAVAGELELLRYSRPAPHSRPGLGSLELEVGMELVKVGDVAKRPAGVLGLPVRMDSFPALLLPASPRVPDRRVDLRLLHPVWHARLTQFLLRPGHAVMLLGLHLVLQHLPAVLEGMLWGLLGPELLLKAVGIVQLLGGVFADLLPQLVCEVEAERLLKCLVPLPRGLFIALPHHLLLSIHDGVARLHDGGWQGAGMEAGVTGGMVLLLLESQLRIKLGGHDVLAG